MMRKKPFEERRRWPRLPVPIPVFVRGLDESGKEFLDFSTILNISAGGVLVASRKAISLGSRIVLEIPHGQPSLKSRRQAQNRFDGRILRRSTINDSYAYAARFKSPLRSS